MAEGKHGGQDDPERGSDAGSGGGAPRRRFLCPRCSTDNALGTMFCTACGAYLAWPGDGPSADLPPTGPDEADADTPAHGPEPEGPEPDAPEPGGPAILLVTPAERHGVVDPPVRIVVDEPDIVDHPGAMSPTSLDLVDTWLGQGVPPPIAPTRREPRLLTVRSSHDARVHASWTLECPWCARMNPPSRVFCRGCAGRLEPVPDVRPWWLRRWLRGIGAAAYEYSQRGRTGRRIRIVVTVACLAGIGYFIVNQDWVGAGRNAFDDRTSPRSQVQPGEVTASGSAGGQAHELSADGATNTFWSPDPNTVPTGQHLDFTFPAPVRLVGIVVYSGASPDATKFLRQARPATGAFILTTARGGKHRVPFRLQDRPGAQSVPVLGSDVVSVRMEIATAYGLKPGRLTAVAEVEFYQRS